MKIRSKITVFVHFYDVEEDPIGSKLPALL